MLARGPVLVCHGLGGLIPVLVQHDHRNLCLGEREMLRGRVVAEEKRVFGLPSPGALFVLEVLFEVGSAALASPLRLRTLDDNVGVATAPVTLHDLPVGTSRVGPAPFAFSAGKGARTEGRTLS